MPCIYADDLTPQQIKAFRIADNKTGEIADWDFDLLEEELQELLSGGYDIASIGFNQKELDEIIAKTVENMDYYLDLRNGDDADDEEQEETEIVEDEAPEIDEENEPITKLGDIWQLGRHRLMCGDSTDRATVEKLMNGAKADMVFTDPPYGMKKESEGVLNDNLNYDDLLEFNKKWIPLTFEVLKENGSWYCWGIDEPLMDIYSNILKPMKKADEITMRNYITWDKGHGLGQLSPQHRQYATATEKAWFVMKGVQGFNNNADNYFEGFEPIRKYLSDEKDKMGWKATDINRITGVTTVASHCFGKSQWEMPIEQHYKSMQTEAQGKAFKREYEEIKREYYSTRAYFDNTHDNMNDVWKFSRTSGEERELTGGHATPKPIALCGRAIKSSSRENESVLDVFGGSGSTLIACEQLDRTCYTMELDPKYCDVIIKRWETLTGQKAELIESV